MQSWMISESLLLGNLLRLSRYGQIRRPFYLNWHGVAVGFGNVKSKSAVDAHVLAAKSSGLHPTRFRPLDLSDKPPPDLETLILNKSLKIIFAF